jgi:hypothetical protein
MSRKLLFLAGALAFAAVYGCGSISNRDNASIATINGTLNGASVPAGTRVALVWAGKNNTWVVSQETAIVSGSFTIDLTTAPADDLFFTPNDSPNVNTPTVSTGDTGNAPPPTQVSGGGSGGTSSGGANIRPKDNVSGSVSGTALSAAIAAFILYVDTNGNGHLDLDAGQDATTPDQIIGGTRELSLVYLRDGSNLDYEKMRDKTSTLPSHGYNVFWSTQSRWLTLDKVELSLKDQGMPYDVCNAGSLAGSSSFDNVSSTDPMPAGGSSGTVGGTNDQSYAWGTNHAAPSTTSGPYPAPGDPNLSCFDNGRTWYYDSCRSGTAPTPGLCGAYHPVACQNYGAHLGSSSATPSGWPCTITATGGAADAGPPNDAGF